MSLRHHERWKRCCTFGDSRMRGAHSVSNVEASSSLEIDVAV